MEKEIRILRDFIQGNEAFAKYESVFRDLFLANFLLGKKGDLEKTKKGLENYLQVRTQKYPSILLSTLPFRTRLHDIKHYRVLSKPDNKGNRVLIFRLSNWEVLENPQETADEWVREFSTLFDTFLHWDSIPFGVGIVEVFDLRGYTSDHTRIISLKILRMMESVTSAYPVRVKVAHFILDSFLISSVLSMIISRLPKKISKRVKFHRNFDSVMEHISPSIWPIELGGEAEDDSCYDLEIIVKMKEMEDYFSAFATAVEQKPNS